MSVGRRLAITFLLFLMGLTPPVHSEAWSYFVSVGAFKVRANAEKLKNKLLTEWTGPPITVKKEKRLHVVLVGPFRTDIEAEIYQVKLDTMGHPAVILRR